MNTGLLKHYGKGWVRVVIYLAAFFLLSFTRWLDRYFGLPTFEQILYHLQFGYDGLAETDPALIRSFILDCIAVPVVLAVTMFFIEALIMSEKISNFLNHLRVSRLANWQGHILRWAAWILKLTRTVFVAYLPLTLMVITFVLLANKLAIWSPLKNRDDIKFFDTHFAAPEAILAPREKLNLVLIYVESLENAFSDFTIMGEDLLAPLNETLKDAHYFENFEQASGTGWTIGGLVSSQCGIPLKPITSFDGNDQGERLMFFLPGATCLGDVLQKNGYNNVFLGGASLRFAGKGKFLAQHGYKQLFGKEDWARLGEKNFNGWGLYDDQLLDRAKSKLDELVQAKEPFNLTLLTVDTHAPDGFYSPTCHQRGASDFKGIVRCTSSLVADFVSYIKRKGYLKNTAVVVLGDHLAMKNAVYEDLEKFAHRTIYNKFLIPHPLEKNRETIHHFSIFPTILYSLGFRFKHNRLALGASGFGELDPNYEILNYHRLVLNEMIESPSTKYLEFWRLPQSQGVVEKGKN